MTLSKVQFAVLMLLAASAAGVGVGWLTRLLPSGPVVAQRQTIEPNGRLKEEITALRNELGEWKKQAGAAAKPAADKTEAVQYQGKPASYYLTALRDRDPEFRKNALEPLAAIAEVDRSVIPAIIAALNDKNSAVQKEAAGLLEYHLDPPAPEAVPTLFRCDLDLPTILPLLKKFDPKGEKTIPLAKAALNDEKIGVRAGFILLAFDNKARLPIPLLARAVTEWEDTICYAKKGDEEREYRKQATVAAQLLRDRGAEAREALPALIEGLKRYSGSKETFYSGGTFWTPNRDDPTDWFIAAVLRVDPQGQAAIPLLLKALDDPDEEHRRNATRMLGEYGAKAKAAVPRLLSLVKSEETKRSAAPAPAVPVSALAGQAEKTASLREIALEALKKIDAKPINNKEPPLAEPSKRAKKGKPSEK